LKRYSVIAEVEKGLYQRFLKSENFDDLDKALKWARSMYHAAYRVTDNQTRQVIKSKGVFKIISI